MTSYSQMLKGVLEGCILAVIEREEIYGYELSVRLAEHGFTFVSEGSIYPLLQRMQKDQFIKGEMRDSPSGPKRKYYTITLEGKRVLKEFRDRWQDVQNAVSQVLNGGPRHENERNGRAQ